MSDENNALEEVKPKTHGKVVMAVCMKGWPEGVTSETTIDIQLANWYQMVDGGADPGGVAYMFLSTQRYIKVDDKFYPALELRYAKFLRLDA